ncbi:MAG TPA: hypothetical protein VGI84_04190 [Pseudonocardiaceae bacterium]|jgi:hypothetical protein
MTVRTSPEDRFDRSPWPDTASEPNFRTGAPVLTLVALLGGALALAIAAVVPVVSAADGAPARPGFTSAPLLVTLALAPAVIALLSARRAPGLAAGLVLGLAVLAPGRALLDCQLVVDAGLATRPELVIPTSLAPFRPGPGLALMFIGHLLIAIAGLLVLAGRWGAEPPDGETAGESAGPQDELVARGAPRQGLLLLVLGCGVVAAVGLVAAPFTSDTAFLLARSVFDGPVWALAGTLLLAVLIPGAGCLFVAAANRERARGGLLGIALGTAAVAVPALAAGLFAADLHPAAGPYAAVAGAVGLAVLAVPAGRSLTSDAGGPERDLVLPGAQRLHRLAGLAALLAGALAAVGALAPALEVPTGAAAPALPVARLLGAAAVVLAVLGVALLLPADRAGASRPALSVAWVVAPLAALAILDPVLTAIDLPGVRFGLGAWAAVGALCLACAAGLLAALAGGVERDDVDLSELAERGADRPVLFGGALAALLAIPAFSLPVADVPGHQMLGIAGGARSGWGLVAGLLAVLLATLAAARCRPSRGAALLAGAGLVVIVRLAELPLVAAPLGGAQPAIGTWACLGCLVVLVAAIALVMRPSRQ